MYISPTKTMDMNKIRTKLLLFLMALMAVNMAEAQVILNEDFNGATPLANWTLVNVDNLTPAANVNYVTNAWVIREDFDTTGQGDFTAVSTSWYTPAGAADDYMISPVINTGTATVLEWDAKAQDASFPDGYEVRISTTGPTVAGLLANPPLYSTTAENASWTRRSLNLSAYANDTVRIAFRNNSNDQFLLLIDNVKLFDPPSADASIASIDAPVTSCNNSAADSVRITISNAGASPLTSVPVGFQLNSGAVVSETYSGNIAPGATDTYTFQTATVNLATPATYNLKAFTALASDGNTNNDSLTSSITSIPVISTIPYTEGFEAGPGGWVSYGANSSWTHGAPAGVYISSAAAGTNAWVTNLSGDYNNNETSYLESPCFDFSTLTTDPVMNFSHIFNTETDWDEGWVELSTDGGVSWTKLVDNGAATNWYNDLANDWWEGNSSAGTGSWVTANNSLTGAAGSASVKVRFVMSSDGSITFEGFGVDDINIAPPASEDVELTSVNLTTTMVATSPITISGTITNRGSNVLNTVEINWTADGGTTINRDTLTGLGLANGASTSFSHQTAWNATPSPTTVLVEVEAVEPNGVADPLPSNNDINTTVLAVLGNTVQKNAVFEQFTTAGCQFCPDGAWVAQQMETNYANVYTTSVHSCFGQDQMTNTEASQLCSTLGNNSAPTGMVDRTLFDGEATVAFGRGNGFPNWSTSTWATRSLANSQAGSAVDVLVSGAFTPGTRNLSVNVDASLVDYVFPGSMNVGLMIIEDSVTGSGAGWDQSNAYNNQAGHPFAGLGNPITNYIHKRVLRDILPGTWGAGSVIPSNYALNTSYSNNFSTTIPTSWDESQIYVIAFVAYFGGSNPANYQILNAERVKMNNLVTGIEDFAKDEASLKVFPNPTANLTNLSFNLSESKRVSLEVVDITGKRLIQEEMGQMVQGNQFIELDVANLAEGFYFLNLRLGEEVITKKISIVR